MLGAYVDQDMSISKGGRVIYRWFFLLLMILDNNCQKSKQKQQTHRNYTCYLPCHICFELQKFKFGKILHNLYITREIRMEC